MLQKASYTWDFLVLNAKDFNLYRWSILKIIFYQRDMIWKYTDLKKKKLKIQATERVQHEFACVSFNKTNALCKGIWLAEHS